MNRPLTILLGGALFGAIGLGSAYGFAGLRQLSQQPDWERTLIVVLPAAWTLVGVLLGIRLFDPWSDRDPRR